MKTPKKPHRGKKIAALREKTSLNGPTVAKIFARELSELLEEEGFPIPYSGLDGKPVFHAAEIFKFFDSSGHAERREAEWRELEETNRRENRERSARVRAWRNAEEAARDQRRGDRHGV